MFLYADDDVGDANGKQEAQLHHGDEDLVYGA